MAEEAGQRVIVASHHPLAGAQAILNREDVQRLLLSSRCVCVCAHVRSGCALLPDAQAVSYHMPFA